jgi:hypothetical protein
MLAASTDCDECETHLEPFEGPPTPRGYTFTVREVAAALYAVGTGESYTQAAMTARLTARRPLMTKNFGAQLVGNWVESLAEVVTARYAETEWPETIVCDSTDFYTKKSPVTGNQVLNFNILAVWGYLAGSPRGRLVALRASHFATQVQWFEVLDLFSGAPRMLVSDRDLATFNAANQKWPQVTPRANWSRHVAEPYIYRCEKHLLMNALTALKGSVDAGPGSPIYHALDTGFHSPAEWVTFRALAANFPGLDLWCQALDAQVLSQSAWRSQLPPHHSNAVTERALTEAKRVIGTRDFALRNKYRTNWMLELVQVNFNRQANETVYARTLREALSSVTVPGR